MQALAARILLLWGVRRAGLAILAGAIGALALPPFNIFAAMFVSFTLLVWLLVDHLKPKMAGAIGQVIVIAAMFVAVWHIQTVTRPRIPPASETPPAATAEVLKNHAEPGGGAAP